MIKKIFKNYKIYLKILNPNIEIIYQKYEIIKNKEKKL